MYREIREYTYKPLLDFVKSRTRKFHQSRPVYLSPGLLFTNTARWLRHYQIYGPSSSAQHSSTSRSCCGLKRLLLRVTSLDKTERPRRRRQRTLSLSQSSLASLLCHPLGPACVYERGGVWSLDTIIRPPPSPDTLSLFTKTYSRDTGSLLSLLLRCCLSTRFNKV